MREPHAIVTGGAEGIGLAIVRALAAAGHRVTIADLDGAKAALRAGEIAAHCSFLSFGTNDLTQMTYGLSRDDAARFMNSYVGQGVFSEDPFHILDQDGVGELVMIGAARARAQKPGITVSMCGEHGGNAESIAFCLRAGLDYVSCSPFRVPVARLAAAQETILRRLADSGRAEAGLDPAAPPAGV